jgi:hypothetical protein
MVYLRPCAVFLTTVFLAVPVYGEDPAGFIGFTLDQLFERFGAPQAVYAARGAEEWQDDVVFVYAQGDFYIFKDRVWQIGLQSAMGIKLGDKRAAILLALGEASRDNGSYLLFPLDPRGWPLALRVNLDSSGAAAAIFVYRDGF